MKIWAKTAEYSEGKFLVVRRDGSIPKWPNFVLGARDPAAPEALREYASEAEDRFGDDDFSDSVRELAGDFEEYRAKHGDGDPAAPPHREDNPVVIAMMRGQIKLTDLLHVFRVVKNMNGEFLGVVVREDVAGWILPAG